MAAFSVFYTAGLNLFSCVRDLTGKVWYPSGKAFEAWGASGHTAANYAAALTDKAGGMYQGEFDGNISPGYYIIQTFCRIGAVPADTDRPIYSEWGVWSGIAWNAVTVKTPADLAGISYAVDICNLAVSMVGGAKDKMFVTDIDNAQPGTVEEMCQKLYPLCRKEVLSEIAPPEATKYAKLSPLSANLPEIADWEYVFSLPSDLLVFGGLIDEDDHEIVYPCEWRETYLFANDLTSSDNAYAYISYTYELKDVTKYSALLALAIATKLASRLVEPLGLKDAKRIALLAEYEELAKPKAMDLAARQQYVEQDFHDSISDSTWLSSRHKYGTDFD